MGEPMKRSPYRQEDRLARIIAAIQIMAIAPWATGSLDSRIRELEGAEEVGDDRERGPAGAEALEKWRPVFEQHPEFFKVYTFEKEERVALRWRFAQFVNYDPTNATVLPQDKIDAMSEKERYRRLTRQPLSAEQIGVLIKTAIDMHSQAIAETQASVRYVPLIAAFLGAAGGFIAAVIGKGH